MFKSCNKFLGCIWSFDLCCAAGLAGAAGAANGAVVVTAAAAVVPERLLDQLNDPGKLIIPLVQKDKQELTPYVKNSDKITKTVLANLKFVPMKVKEFKILRY